MVRIFNKIIETLIGILFIPFQNLHPIWGLLFISALAAIFMLLIFKKTSNQSAIRRTRKRISGYILGIRFYRDNQGLIFNAIKNIFLTNLHYLKHFIKPFLILLIPMGLMVIHTGLFYQHRPLQSEEKCTLTVKIEKEYNEAVFEEIRLNPSEGIEKETPPVRILSCGEVHWRLRTVQQGIHPVHLIIGDEEVTYWITVNNHAKLRPIQPLMLKNTLIQLLYPGGTALPSNHPIESISVAYPPGDLSIAGFHINWLVAFILFSVIFAYLMKGIFKIEF